MPQNLTLAAIRAQSPSAYVAFFPCLERLPRHNQAFCPTKANLTRHVLSHVHFLKNVSTGHEVVEEDFGKPLSHAWWRYTMIHLWNIEGDLAQAYETDVHIFEHYYVFERFLSPLQEWEYLCTPRGSSLDNMIYPSGIEEFYAWAKTQVESDVSNGLSVTS